MVEKNLFAMRLAAAMALSGARVSAKIASREFF